MLFCLFSSSSSSAKLLIVDLAEEYISFIEDCALELEVSNVGNFAQDVAACRDCSDGSER